MQATVTTLGELGKNKKPKKARAPKAKRPKGTRANNPALPNFDYSIVGATPLFNSAPPPPAPSYIAPSYIAPSYIAPSYIAPIAPEGHSTRDSILATINNGIDSIFNKGDGSGNNLSPGEIRLTQRENVANPNDPNSAANAAHGIGKSLDEVGKTVTSNPLLFGGIGIALLLLFMKPPSRNRGH